MPEFVFEQLTAKDVVNTDSSDIATGTPTTNIENLESANLEEERKINKDNGIKIFDELVAKPTSVKVRNTLEMLQNLCLYQEKANDIRDLLQRFESFHALDVTKARKLVF